MEKPTLLSTVELRKQNRNRVYMRLVTSAAPMTKQDLAQELSLSLPTLTQNLRELLALGLIDDSTTTDSTGGRKPRLIAAVPDARYAIGCELSRGHIRMAAIGLTQNRLAFQSIARSFQNDEAYARELAAQLERFLDKNELPRKRLLGVGLTLPGIINADQDTIEYAPTIGLHKMSKSRITGLIPYPTYLDNDATCGGFAEWWNRAERGNMAYLSLSRGIGGAILIGGSAYDGSHRRSGEFGHMCIRPGGRDCNCGRKGCLEAYCSAARLSDDLGITLERFFAGVAGGNRTYREIWEDYLENLAIAVNNIHTVLDCDVVLGGSVSPFLGEFQPRLGARLRELNPFSETGDYLHLCRFHGQSICIGAAMRFTTRFMESV